MDGLREPRRMPNPAAVGADVDDPAAVGIRSGSGAALTLSCRNSRHCWNPFLEVSAVEADPSRALTSWQHCLAPFGMTWRQPVSPAGGSGLGRQGTGAAWRCVPPFPSSDEAPGRTPGASPSSAGAGGGRTTPPHPTPLRHQLAEIGPDNSGDVFSTMDYAESPTGRRACRAATARAEPSGNVHGDLRTIQPRRIVM